MISRSSILCKPGLHNVQLIAGGCREKTTAVSCMSGLNRGRSSTLFSGGNGGVRTICLFTIRDKEQEKMFKKIKRFVYFKLLNYY